MLKPGKRRWKKSVDEIEKKLECSGRMASPEPRSTFLFIGISGRAHALHIGYLAHSRGFTAKTISRVSVSAAVVESGGAQEDLKTPKLLGRTTTGFLTRPRPSATGMRKPFLDLRPLIGLLEECSFSFAFKRTLAVCCQLRLAQLVCYARNFLCELFKLLPDQSLCC